MTAERAAGGGGPERLQNGEGTSTAVTVAGAGGRGAGGRGGRGGAARGGRGGAGTRMLEGVRKRGQPVTPKLQEMADWLDSLEADAGGGDGGVCATLLLNPAVTCTLASFVLLVLLRSPESRRLAGFSCRGRDVPQSSSKSDPHIA